VHCLARSLNSLVASLVRYEVGRGRCSYSNHVIDVAHRDQLNSPKFEESRVLARARTPEIPGTRPSMLFDDALLNKGIFLGTLQDSPSDTTVYPLDYIPYCCTVNYIQASEYAVPSKKKKNKKKTKKRKKRKKKQKKEKKKRTHYER